MYKDLELFKLHKIWKMCCDKFGKQELLEELREYYKNICSNGDVLIHSAIDDFEKYDKISTLELISPNLHKTSYDDKLQYTQKCLDHLCETILEWLENQEMN